VFTGLTASRTFRQARELFCARISKNQHKMVEKNLIIPPNGAKNAQ
jgi:hypothetical protein